MSETFTKRPGTTDKGKDYEHLYIAYLVLKLLQKEKINNFFISSNDKNYGSFDDVVVEIENDQRERKIFALQLKHKESNKRILAVNALAASKGDHSFEKYYLDYAKTEKIQNATNVILLTNSRAKIPEKIQLNFEAQEFEVNVSKTSGDGNFLATLKGGSCYTFTSTNRYEQFFHHLILCTGQAGVEEIRREIRKSLKEFFACDEAVFKEYLNFIIDWSMKKGEKFKLEKAMMKRVITMCVLSPHIKPLSFSSSSATATARIFRKAISKFDTTVLKEESYEKIKKLWEDVVCDLNFENVSKVISTYHLILKDINKNEDLYSESKEISKLLWLLNVCPLVVQGCKQSYHATEFCKDEKFVLLCSDVRSTSDSFQHLSDLKIHEDIYVELLDNLTYSLEGQKEAPLRNLLEVCPVEDQITVDDLLQMIDSPLIIGKEKEDIPPCHVPRTLSKIVIKFQYLKKVTTNDTVIAISCVKDVDRFKQQFPRVQITVLEDNETKIDNFGIYITAKEQFHPQIELEGKPSIKYHHFRFLGDDLLEWIASSNVVDDLKEFHLEHTDHTLQEYQLYDSFCDNIVNIFCCNPGMGKSTLMKSLKKNSSSEIWKVLLSARNHVIHFRKHGNHITKFLDYIVNVASENAFDKRIFENFSTRNKIHVTWDGLDEISDDNLTMILDMVEEISKNEIPQQLTSRNNLKNILEKRFSTLSREILQFDEQEQRKYIKERLNLSNEELSEVFQKIQNNIRLFANNDILGIPLQIYMLTELCHNDRSKYLNLLDTFFSIADLYQYFIEEKFNVYYRDKLEHNVKIEANYQRCLKDKRYKLQCYKEVAFDLYVGHSFFKEVVHLFFNKPYKTFLEEIKESSDPIGLITQVTRNNIPEFSHNSYGEYFAALYLSENYETKVRNKKFIFNEKYNNIRFFLDLILSKNCKGHIAVMYRNWKFLEKCTDDDLRDCDKVGRTILEIACNWNREGSCVEFDSFSFDFADFCEKFEFHNRNKFKKLIYEDVLADFTQIQDYGPLNRNLKKLMYLIPTVIPPYAKSLRNYKYEKLFVKIVLYLGIKLDCSLIFNCIETIPWMRSVFKNLDLKSVLNWALDCESADVVGILFSKYNCQNIIIENADIGIKLCKETFSNFFYVAGSNFDADTFINPVCAKGNLNQVKFLIDKGARIDVIDKYGKTPLQNTLQNTVPNATEIIKLLIANGANLNLQDNTSGPPPLHIACLSFQSDSEKYVKLLIQNGAKLDVADRYGLRPIHYACESQDFSVVKLLIESGAKVHVVDRKGLMPIHFACRRGKLSTVKLLINNDAKVDAADQAGLTPIHHACKNKDFSVAKLLIDSGAKVNVVDGKGLMPIHYACRCSTLSTVKLLINNGAKVDETDQAGLTPVHCACENEHFSVLKLLIDSGAKVDVVDRKGLMPIHYACRRSKLSTVKVLINNGAEVDAADQAGLTPIHYACMGTQSDAIKIVNLLFSNGANFDVADQNGQMPIHYACKNHFRVAYKIIKELINNGAKVDVADQNGLMPIHYLCKCTHLKSSFPKVDAAVLDDMAPVHNKCAEFHLNVDRIIKLLIGNGATVNMADLKGRMPMHYACQNEHLNVDEIIKLLIANGAKLDAADLKGRTTMHYACKNAGIKMDKIITFLMTNGVKVDVVDQKGRTPMHYACKNGDWNVHESIKLLITNGAKVDVVDQKGRTPMHYACKNGDWNVHESIKLLITNGANVDVVDQKGRTPMHYACKNANWNVDESIKILLNNGAKVDVVDRRVERQTITHV